MGGWGGGEGMGAVLMFEVREPLRYRPKRESQKMTLPFASTGTATERDRKRYVVQTKSSPAVLLRDDLLTSETERKHSEAWPASGNETRADGDLPAVSRSCQCAIRSLSISSSPSVCPPWFVRLTRHTPYQGVRFSRFALGG